jgi:hypothetical protein
MVKHQVLDQYIVAPQKVVSMSFEEILEVEELLGEGELQRWDEVWRMGKQSHQIQRLGRYILGRKRRLNTSHLCACCYIQEIHIAWIGRLTCVGYRVEGLANRHNQKHEEMYSQVFW